MTIEEIATEFKRYSEYQDSGVEWLGEIPKHWEARRVKTIFRLVAEPAGKDNGYELLSVYTDIGVKPRKELEERGNKASTTDGYWLVRKGDVIVNKLLAWMGAIGISKYEGVTSPAYDILRPVVNVNGDFYHSLFRTPTCISELKKHSRGIMEMRLRLYFDKFGDVVVPYPPIEEQNAIANFLDKKCTKIDKVIAQKQKMIALLKERKQILIQNAVTKGLDPNVEMKDSGVEWIGEIPGHWEVKKLKHLIKGNLKYGANESGVEYDKDLPRYIRITDFSQDGKLNEDKKLSLLWNDGKDYLLQDGDILFARSGATVGKSYQFKSAMSTEEYFAFAGYLIKATPDNNKILSDFLMYYTVSGSFESWKSFIFNKATIENIGADKYSQLLLTVPSTKEQNEIVTYLITQSIKIDKAIKLQERQIERLKEYKSVLIEGAVTGKIKVY